MSTLMQKLQYYKKKEHKHYTRSRKLRKNPFAKGIVRKVVVENPKKPNSAMRHVAKISLYSGLDVKARITGSGYMVAKYNRILVRGGTANDLPMVNNTIVRGKYDCSPLFNKKRKRSKYGVSKPKE